jgi:endonuclease YncB( thermonuclease family)
VTHVRDGDTIEVSGVPVRIANLDCAELGTAAGNHANAVMRRWAATATASCLLEGRKS